MVTLRGTHANVAVCRGYVPDLRKVLRQLRTAAGWTIRQVEEVTGVSNAVISQIETGHVASPRWDTVCNILAGFGYVLRLQEVWARGPLPLGESGDCDGGGDHVYADTGAGVRCVKCMQPAPRPLEEAKAAHMPGWNLRCNRCGSYGAELAAGERPGGGALALCAFHKDVLRRAHDGVWRARRVVFEQEAQAGR